MSTKKAPLYSPSRRAAKAVAAGPATPAAAPLETPVPAAPPRRAARLARAYPALLWSLLAALLVCLGTLVWLAGQAPAAKLTQAQFDAAVRHSLEKEPLPSQAVKAYLAIAGSVVRVEAFTNEEDHPVEQADQRAMDRSLGTGVVIKDDGTILTSLHVVMGARRLRVTFHDGLEAPAKLIGVQPENDLAVLRPARVPDDLVPATMRSTGDLLPGDHVIAVGHPFGIGPSVSYGVVSGLRREFQSPEGQQLLTNLIQFDAAANPGNSGGPLVTMDGNVVGIVTAILNPNEQRTFVGIGFAVPIENAAAAAGMSPF